MPRSSRYQKIITVEAPEVSRRLLEPIGTPEAIARVIADLVDDLVVVLRRGLGVRAAAITAERVDGADQHLSIGASRVTRDSRHLVRMFGLRIDRLKPGLGIEAMRLVVPHSEPLGARISGALIPDGDLPPDLAPAIDQLAGRAGAGAIFRMGLAADRCTRAGRPAIRTARRSGGLAGLEAAGAYPATP